MATDKWGLPHLYPTAKDAGITGTGSAFIWYQANNIFDDSDKGMVRIGKEYDDVDVISTTTGEWEFPYDDGADYYCLETETGHHSGGESHGCEGAEYNVNVTINTTPPQFYFQKQMYHGGTKYERGRKTHPKAIEKVVGNGWKGLCAVRYNIKDGVGPGKDSVKLEIWWCEDPDNHKDTWVKVNETEDKGGWGKNGDSCNGRPDQQINWSNVQFRYKSGTPEWSVHPRIPEFENGDNIHSIGGADMDFAACERRGYGKRADMPRDIEQKILFKFASNNGIARLKNASLREISPQIAADDTPDVPDEPQETTTISGKLKLQWDLNILRASPCAGIGAGGAGGNAVFYDVQICDDERFLVDHVDHANRTREAEKITATGSSIKGKTIHQADFCLRKGGSPTGNVLAKIWNASNQVVYTSPTTVAASGLATSLDMISFNFATNTHVMVVGDYIGVEYTASTNASNYVAVGIRDADLFPSSLRSNYEAGVWHDVSSGELSALLWD